MFGWLHFFFLPTILQDGALTTAIRAFNTGQFCSHCRSNLASSGASTTSSSLLGSYCSCACTRLSPIELNLSLEKLISHPHQIQHAFSKQITGWYGCRMVISVLVLLVTFSSFSIDLLNFNYGDSYRSSPQMYPFYFLFAYRAKSISSSSFGPLSS